MANLDIDFGTFNLNSTNGVSIADIAIETQKAIEQSVIPKGGGSVIPIGPRASVVVRLSGKIVGTSYTTLRDNIQALKAALDQTSEQKFTLDDERFIRMQYRNFAYSYAFINGVANWSCQLVASDPYWYSETLNSDSTLITAAPSQDLDNDGDAVTRCKLTITALAGNPITDDLLIENSTLGTSLQYRGTIAATKSLVINNRVDQDQFTVVNDGTDDIVNYEGDLPTMAAGTNTWDLTTATTGVIVKVEWRDAWV